MWLFFAVYTFEWVCMEKSNDMKSEGATSDLKSSSPVTAPNFSQFFTLNTSAGKAKALIWTELENKAFQKYAHLPYSKALEMASCTEEELSLIRGKREASFRERPNQSYIFFTTSEIRDTTLVLYERLCGLSKADKGQNLVGVKELRYRLANGGKIIKDELSHETYFAVEVSNPALQQLRQAVKDCNSYTRVPTPIPGLAYSLDSV